MQKIALQPHCNHRIQNFIQLIWGVVLILSACCHSKETPDLPTATGPRNCKHGDGFRLPTPSPEHLEKAKSARSLSGAFLNLQATSSHEKRHSLNRKSRSPPKFSVEGIGYIGFRARGNTKPLNPETPNPLKMRNPQLTRAPTPFFTDCLA